MTPPADTIPELAATLGAERDSILVAAAALQLLPENATKWMRFERLVEACSGAPDDEEQFAVSTRRLRELLTIPPIVTGSLLSAEDPFEESFTAEITFYGGSYTVIMGGTSAAHSACQFVLNAARLLEPAGAEYRDALFADAEVLLRLSDELCRRAGLARWMAPAESPSTPLRIPADTEFARLTESCVFTEEDLTRLLGAAAAHVDDLVAPGPMGLVEHDDDSPTDDRIYLYPLLRVASGVVIPVPGAVAGSIVHRALARAVDEGIREQVVESLHQAVVTTVERYLGRVRWVPIGSPPGLEPTVEVRETFWRFDLDKVAHVVTVVDPLDGYEAGKPYASVELRSIQDELHRRFVEVRSRREDLGASEVLHVVCSAVLGRTWFLGFTSEATDERSALLVLTVDDLDVLTGLDPNDPVALWKFARASTALHERCRVLSFSKLDEFAIYRGHSDGFYLGDDRPPTLLTVQPGTGAGLRVSERKRRDPHALPLPSGRGVAQVALWAADDGAPIYRPEHPGLHALHVVELDLPCWIEPAPGPAEPPEPSEDLAEAVAFWLWRCAGDVNPALALLHEQGVSHLVIRVRLSAQTVEDDPSPVDPVAEWMRCETSNPNRVDLTLLETAGARLWGPGNEAERAMAGTLTAAIHRLAHDRRPGLDLEIRSALPHGAMKMFQVLGQEDDLLLSLGYTARPRMLVSADVEEVLDEVGEICRDNLGINEGPIPDAERTPVLNSVVGELFARMGRMISGLDPSGLLEHLAAEQEAIAFLDARDRLLVPSQAACFGEDSSCVTRAVEGRQSMTSTGVASRFLIEYVTAVPPTGAQPLSVCTYDRLLAYAKEIVEFGFLSDAIRYGLSTTELAVLPSGRLGSSREEPFHETIQLFTRLTPRRALDAARRGFERHWRDPDDVAEALDPAALNGALLAEFGLTAGDHARIAGDLMELSRNVPRQVVAYMLDELIERLAGTMDWDGPRVRQALDLFMLGPLPAFPPREDAADTYPWRFSRDRSAARRPLFARPTSSGGLEVVWGPRSVYRSSRYLLDQIMSARLKATSTAMKHYIAAARREANDDFNRQVADIYRQAGCDDVRENVKRLGTVRLRRQNGEDIGDIDVLAIDCSHRVLLAVEVKDFEFARTPFELSNEVDKLLGDEDSAVSHHEERLAFIKANLPDVLTQLGIDDRPRDWQVQGLVVTSTDLMAAHFPQAARRKSRIKIVSFEALTKTEPRTLISRTRVNPSTRTDRRRRRRH